MKEDLLKKLNSNDQEKRHLIHAQLRDFRNIYGNGNDERIFEELTFCILTSGVRPRIGLKELDAVKDGLIHGGEEELYMKLEDEHKYPEKAGHIVHTRGYLRRDFFASKRDIKGMGYLRASHFLRNVGFLGYALLDKNVSRSLYELGVIENVKPPTTRN